MTDLLLTGDVITQAKLNVLAKRTGVDASKGSPLYVGDGYFATDTSILYISSDGVNWDQNIGIPTTTNYQVFTSSGTWTKPLNVSWAYIVTVGGGGGGGLASVATGGGGGGGGGKMIKLLPTSVLGSTETVTVGASVASNIDGNPSSFGTITYAFGGLKGITSAEGGAGGSALFVNRTSATAFGGAGASAPAVDAAANPAEYGGASGGCGDYDAAGYVGGASNYGGGGGGGGAGHGISQYAGGVGGKSGNNAGGDHGAAGTNTTVIHEGAGGGGGNSNAAGAGESGGAGGNGGGGGGGGGSGTTGNGIGGAGGRGEVRILCW